MKSDLPTRNSYGRRMWVAFLQTSPLHKKEFSNTVLDAVPPLTQKFGLLDLSDMHHYPPHRDYIKTLPTYYSSQD